jgi:hypothetical protein
MSKILKIIIQRTTTHAEDNIMSDLLVSDTLKKAFNIAVEFIKDNPSTSLSIMFTNYSGDLVAQQWNEGTSALRSILNQSDISLNGDEMARLFHVLALDTIEKKRELERYVFEIVRDDCNIKRDECKTVLGYKITSREEYRSKFPRYVTSDGFAFPPIKI